MTLFRAILISQPRAGDVTDSWGVLALRTAGPGFPRRCNERRPGARYDAGTLHDQRDVASAQLGPCASTVGDAGELREPLG